MLGLDSPASTATASTATASTATASTATASCRVPAHTEPRSAATEPGWGAKLTAKDAPGLPGYAGTPGSAYRDAKLSLRGHRTRATLLHLIQYTATQGGCHQRAAALEGKEGESPNTKAACERKIIRIKGTTKAVSLEQPIQSNFSAFCKLFFWLI